MNTSLSYNSLTSNSIFPLGFNFTNFENIFEAKGVDFNTSFISAILNPNSTSIINLNSSMSASRFNSIITAIANYKISHKNITEDIPYGKIMLAGRHLGAMHLVNTSIYNKTDNSLYLVKIKIVKASPQLCVDTNLGDVCTTTNQTTPVPLGVPVIGGHFGLTNNNWYPLNVSFKSSLLANNTASWNVTIKDITNNTILFSKTINSSNINITKNYKIPVTHQVEMIIKTSGNQNYTSLVEDPVTIPSGIQYYVAVNITNSQTTATPSPFQQMIQINKNNYTSYMTYNSNFANFEFFYQNLSLIHI